ncbi:hypothetical protein [Pseudozobellia sp. WGM2]|uniref:hypothetical protein n=1 Tax=Pseudozobellia sp. WGM2 TaxID=2787625 RepID=UPI001AE01865|nr:hypothetical protein [Pseudozobellia sp. WGM2]
MNESLLQKTAVLFDFNEETNIPTFYSSLTLLACSLLLYYIYRSKILKDYSAKSWLMLSGVFLFLGIDEMASIHEQIMVLLQNSFEFTGVFYYAWIIPYGIAIIISAIVYLPFLWSLPKQIKALFILSACLFIGGAVGVEIIGGQHDEMYGKHNLTYSLLYTIEELLEMIGVAIFLYALLVYIELYSGFENLKIKVESVSQSSNKIQEASV